MPSALTLNDAAAASISDVSGLGRRVRGNGECKMTSGIASNWGREQGLSLFGRWHTLSFAGEGQGQTLCGKYVYASPDRIPTYYRRLQRISAGSGKGAPQCAKCERAQQARGW